MSIPSQAALTHLRAIKPNDGWGIKKDGKKFQLLRRNVSLSDEWYLGIHYDSDQNLVVGIMEENGSSCRVLVDERGVPVSGNRIVSVSNYDPNSAKGISFANTRRSQASQSTTTTSTTIRGLNSTSQTGTSTNTNRNFSFNSNSNANGGDVQGFSLEQNEDLVKYALIFVGACFVLRVLSEINSTGLLIVALPLVYLYALQTCPTMNSFDAKKELKRVFRGHHLPENHPNKPKGFFEDIAARVAASVTAELATLPGYELTMTPFGGAAILAEVRVPTAKTQCYWVGAFGKWRYITSREIPDRHYD